MSHQQVDPLGLHQVGQSFVLNLSEEVSNF
jgi:hypothetical protein